MCHKTKNNLLEGEKKHIFSKIESSSNVGFYVFYPIKGAGITKWEKKIYNFKNKCHCFERINS